MITEHKGVKLHRPIKKSSQEIIDALKAGVSQRQLALKGYPESTVTYYYRKLFKPKRFRRFIGQVRKYQENNKK